MNSVEEWLTRFEWQPTLWADTPRRRVLASLHPKWPLSPTPLHVHRNSPVEHVLAAGSAWLSYAGMDISSTTYGDYDDSLSFNSDDPKAVAELIWIDFDRLFLRSDVDKMLAWFSERVQARRAYTTRPLLIANWASAEPEAMRFNVAVNELLALGSVVICDLAEIASDMGDAYFDKRGEQFAGGNLSSSAMVETGRRLASWWLPAALRPAMKAVVVDLDGTIYSGVLGEDGVQGVTLTDEHKKLQQELVRLHDDGVMLAVVSKNEMDDVDALFAARSDFPLRLHHFAAHSVSWASKSEGLAGVVEEMHISDDAVVYLDDNPGELSAIAASGARAHLVLASDPAIATRGLRWVPGLQCRGSVTAVDRTADIRADVVRRELAAQTPDEYLASLEVVVTVSTSDVHVPRAAELIRKTNQFNLSLGRMSEAELRQGIGTGELVCVTAGLRDRLSDSGVIAALIARDVGDAWVVEELDISCRALGRQIEDALVAAMQMALPVPRAATFWNYTSGPRNKPALDWLAQRASKELDSQGSVKTHESVGDLGHRVASLPITVERT